MTLMQACPRSRGLPNRQCNRCLHYGHEAKVSIRILWRLSIKLGFTFERIYFPRFEHTGFLLWLFPHL
jgi:hypothetical protein